MANESWLLRDGTDRERMIDMDRRLQTPRRTSFIVLAAALVASGPWLGWWQLLPLLIAGLAFKAADDHIAQTARPEHWVFAAWALSVVIIATSVALTGGPTVPMMAWLCIPIVTLSARFSVRGIAVGVAFTILAVLAVAFGVNAHAVWHYPPLIFGPIALVISVAILSTALMQSDVEHRSEAVIDELTGLLNRKSLTHRVVELTQQARMTGQPIGVIVGDLDHFKAINDSAGHSVGDAVLHDVAALLRSQLRAFDLAYRIGGEEFLVLLPGSGLAQSAVLAEQLRRAVASATFGGSQRLTISFGVAASEPSGDFDYAAVFASADAALYEAKDAGRNRVRGGPQSLAAIA
jgi:diguanylate cyclase (GGDEF)-like protein